MKKFNHFSIADAGVNIGRSTFARPNTHKGTMPTGKLIPLYVDEVLPGDTRKIDITSVIRGATPKYPVMDNAFFDIASFFVPHRIVFDNWEEFMGENNKDMWTNEEEFVIPQVEVQCMNGAQGLLLNTPIDYMNSIGQLCGVDISDGEARVSNSYGFSRRYNALFPRSMCKVWNDWYRNQNLQDPCHIYKDMTDRAVVVNDESINSDNYVEYGEFGTCLLPVNKFKDYFTSALPAPLKHAPISLPLGEFAPIQNNYGPVNDILYGETPDYTNFFSPYLWDANGYPLNIDVSRTKQAKLTPWLSEYANSGVTYSNLGYLVNPNENVGSGTPEPSKVQMSLVANLREATAVTVNQLRLAFQTQKFYEKQALYGSRYTELLYSMFGVYSADARLQRAEFLSGKRIPIHQYQVNQTAQNNSKSAGLGSTGAFSLTNDNSRIVNKSFTEHGLLMIFGYVRTYQSYSQGQDRMFTRREMFDYYFPVFSHIGEQPIKNDEIFAIGDVNFEETKIGKENFGYQEAWSEYRFKQNRISGLLRPEVGNNLASWHYGSMFNNLPILGSEFAKETEENVKRSQVVDTDSQWIFDCYFDDVAVRPMPVFSIPGLIDHF